ncbi:MAG: hypothetical protein HYT15_04315 [Candidatus Magasanikbacteria bacterium]|nr:hypothetical protein [Candidatus Magasanikbacteria bacterium]
MRAEARKTHGGNEFKGHNLGEYKAGVMVVVNENGKWQMKELVHVSPVNDNTLEVEVVGGQKLRVNEAPRIVEFGKSNLITDSKRGGDIIIDTPNLNSWSNRILMILGFPPTNYTPYPGKTPGVPKILGTAPVWDHPRVFPYRTLKEIFNSSGFKLKSILGVNKTDKDASFRNLRIVVEKITPQSWREIIAIKATIEK